MAPDGAGNSMSAFIRLVERLEAHGCRVTGNGRKRMATCPAHDDSTASLSIGDGDGRALVWCHGGCPTDAVLDALGLSFPELFDGGGPSTRPLADDWAPWQRDRCSCAPAMVFSYESAGGRLLYQVVRGRHKEFAQRRPDPLSRSGWRWNLDGAERVLLRLPQLSRAGDHDVIFVVEGERDVLALEAAGEFATCNPGGALNGSPGKRWLPEWSETLRGRDVLIVADRDRPGRAHARHVAAELDGIARFTWIVEAAAGNDARDHLKAGLGVADFTWWTR
jgi:5S rRNA maturation endonuclease (ribonuclease M5)